METGNIKLKITVTELMLIVKIKPAVILQPKAFTNVLMNMPIMLEIRRSRSMVGVLSIRQQILPVRYTVFVLMTSGGVWQHAASVKQDCKHIGVI